MSLILLSSVSDQFIARDLAGRVLPGATLDFFVAGTSEPADVGDDDGHFQADAGGAFEQIALAAGVSYRIVHKTADGVLIYDVDPYVCTCGDDAPTFRSPIQRAFDGDGVIAPGAELYSFEADGETLQPLYADAALARPLPNPIVANAAGIFESPIYADDANEYVLTLLDADGNLLEEFDPYVCACGVGPDFVFDAGSDFGLTGYANGFFGTLVEVSAGLTSVLDGGSISQMWTGSTMNLVADNASTLSALAGAYQSFTIVETGVTWPIPGGPGSGPEWVYQDPVPFENGQRYSLVFNPVTP